MVAASRRPLPLALVAHDDPGIAEALRHAVTSCGWRAAVAEPRPHGLAATLALGPAVAVVGCGLLGGLPGSNLTPVLAIGDDNRPGDLRAAVASGARGILAWPDGAADLPSELHRLSAPARPPRPPAGGTVVAVTGVQGGAGATTLAAHLAGTWARWGHPPVLLADLAGGLGFRLDLDAAAPGWPVAAAMAEGPGAALTAGVLAEPWPGLMVVPLPAAPGLDAVPDPTTIADVLSMGRQSCGVVVVDVPLRADPAIHAVLSAADVMLAVSRPDSAGLRGLEDAAELWDAAGNEAASCGLVVMGAAPNAALATRVFRSSLGTRLWSVVDAAPAEFGAAAEDGALLLDRTDMAAVQAILTLASRTIPLAHPVAAR